MTLQDNPNKQHLGIWITQMVAIVIAVITFFGLFYKMPITIREMQLEIKMVGDKLDKHLVNVDVSMTEFRSMQVLLARVEERQLDMKKMLDLFISEYRQEKIPKIGIIPTK